MPKAISDFSKYKVDFSYGHKQVSELDNSILINLVKKAMQAAASRDGGTKDKTNAGSVG